MISPLEKQDVIAFRIRLSNIVSHSFAIKWWAAWTSLYQVVYIHRSSSIVLTVSGGFYTHLKSYGKCTIHEIRFLLWDTEAFIACKTMVKYLNFSTIP